MDRNEFRKIRQELGLSIPELCVMLKLKGDRAANSLLELERKGEPTGPMALAMEHLLGKHRGTCE